LAFRFFAGKGGVGKTTCAVAAAVRAAERGSKVLVVSTDPAHSLGDALGKKLSARATRVPTARGQLYAAELDADRALARWLGERRGALEVVAERGTYLDAEDIDRLLELSLPGTDELVGLLELVALASQRPYDEVVVDTAPTGHTLRLLSMPETLRGFAEVLDDMQAKHRLIAERLGGRYRPDAADRVIEDIDAEAAALHELLRDPRRTSFSWVVTPDELAVQESVRGVRALERAGIRVAELVVNRVLEPGPDACSDCRARIGAEAEALRALERALRGVPLIGLTALDDEPRGVAALRRVGRALEARTPVPRSSARVQRGRAGATRAGPGGAVERLVGPQTRLLLVGGKGGVGKTTCAAALALALAEQRPRARVLLLSSDPAHSLADAFDRELDDEPRRIPTRAGRLFARELDGGAQFAALRERYRDSIEAVFEALTRGSRFELVYDRQVMEDLIELAPPGMDELFAILAVVEALLEKGRRRFDVVVLDTAPTGHTLRLLALPETALAWTHAMLAILLKYRQVIGLGQLARDLLDAAQRLKRLRDLLRDRALCRFVVVSRPAELPLLETRRLIRELSRREIEVSGVIANQIWHGSCSRCRRRIALESRKIGALRKLAGAKPLMVAPAEPRPPRGATSLLDWSKRWETA
jgi:arsenite/tail-anchored protein-transporting ATPase